MKKPLVATAILASAMFAVAFVIGGVPTLSSSDRGTKFITQHSVPSKIAQSKSDKKLIAKNESKPALKFNLRDQRKGDRDRSNDKADVVGNRSELGIKHDGDSREDKAGIANEGPSATYEAEQAAIRAFPASTFPTDATLQAQATFQSFKQGGNSVGQWSPIGPLQQARYPGVLDVFLFDGATYIASGRVTALAIAPSCSGSHCRVYAGAAGGGIWVTDKALDGNATWSFTTGSLGSNAVGSILIDPSDSSGNTVYVGTGEPNASGDSEAGVGIYKSTDGGQTWTLVPGSGIFFQRSIGQMALDNAGNLLVPIASGVRGIASDDGGAVSSGNAAHPLVTRGLYRQTGSTFTRIFTAPAPTRGSTTVKVDPTHAGIIYVNAFQQGIWRSTNNGATFSQIFLPQDPTVAGSAIDRSEFDVNTLASGATRMYVGEGQGGGGGHHSNFWRSDNADTAAVFGQMAAAQTDNYCTGQCWYDNYVVTPAGQPDVVYLGGSFQYGEVHGKSNARAVLLSTDGGATFTDMTQDGDPTHAESMHPDQHALVTVPGNPLQFIEGSDGGVIRSDGQFANVSSKCDTRGLNPADTAYCKSLLSRVPNKLITVNQGLDTLQFQSLSVSAQHPTNLLQGGTQDNGTFQYSGSAAIWPQIIYGDGGQSGFRVSDDHLRFNSFAGQFHDANFHNGDPTEWVVISAPIVQSPEGSLFYPPLIADPNPAASGSIFEGSFSVWRTQDWGGNQAFLEANCPEFTTDSTNPASINCGDFVPIGDGVPSTRLTSATWGSRAGGAVSWIARAPQNTGTMWASTTGGRLFITDNANDVASAVHWFRLDQTAANSPGRVITNIYVDPANANHAWVSYSGYNVNTPPTPGHVFEVTRDPIANTATWVDLSLNLDDFPADAIVRDDVTGDLYVGTDFAVFRLASGGSAWTMTGGMPTVEVPGLTIVPSARVLYAATHGLGAWVLDLSKVK